MKLISIILKLAWLVGFVMVGISIGAAIRYGDVIYAIDILPWLGGSICFYLADMKQNELNAKSNGFKPNTYLMRSFDKRKTVAKRRRK